MNKAGKSKGRVTSYLYGANGMGGEYLKQGHKLYVTLSVAKGLRRFAAGFFTPSGRSE